MKFSSAKLGIIITSFCSGALLLASGFAAAWFYENDEIDINNGISGAVLQKYFHSGTGTSTDPFIITRPKHYENMVLLHYNLEGFADVERYFEIGTDLGNGVPEVYEYVDGRYTGKTTTNLACTHIAALPPLGTSHKPFNGHVEGNGLTVSGFTVNASREIFSDVGVFGYVNEGTCSNVYFRDFTIDTSAAAYPEIDNLGQIHEHDFDNAHVGYLAGHMYDCSLFKNVYANNCTLTGSTSVRQINNYGYYGTAVQDSLGSDIGLGANYEFTLDAEAIYRYFSGAYTTISDKRALIRNTEETVGYPNDERDLNPTKFSDAITRNQLSYGMTGNTPNNPTSQPRNYSVSTLGYRGYPMDYVENHYDIVEKHTGTNAVPAYDTQVTTQSIDELVNGTDMDGNPYSADNPLQGDYFYFNSTETADKPVGWRLLHASARPTTEGQDTTTVRISIPDVSYRYTSLTSVDNDQNIAETTLYFDDVPYNVPTTVTGNNAFLSTTRRHTVSFTPISIPNVDYGVHKISFVSRTVTHHSGTAETYYHYYGNLTDTSLLQKDIIVSNKVSTSYSLTSDGTVRNALTQNPTHYTFTPVAYLKDDYFDTPLYCVATNKSASGVYSEVSLSTNHRNMLDAPGAVFEYQNGRWYASASIYQEDTSKTEEDFFIGEAPELVASGYSSKNLDLVGGGVSFTSQNLLGNAINVINIPSEANNATAMVKKITTADLGKKFYATERCANSVVLYIKNTSNARDTRDDVMGNITFRYASVESLTGILGNNAFTRWLISQQNIGKPVFKKGNKETLLLENYGVKSTSGLNAVNTLKDLKESQIMQTSLCALDRSGNILGAFNADGTPGVGFASASDPKLAKIATYVVVLGSYSTGNDSTNTWITRIDFDYKAEAGYGGTFGSVGYRDASDTIENTILNFYFDNPLVGENYVDFQYFIRVLYIANPEGSTFEGVYHIQCYSSVATTLRIYNYYPDKYQVYLSTSKSTGKDTTTGVDNFPDETLLEGQTMTEEIPVVAF
ncbi:MAG: hypothetical protein MJ220_04315 [Bacilli bacterium]|nr:hypothetical protein [Bacilli bacterium]